MSVNRVRVALFLGTVLCLSAVAPAVVAGADLVTLEVTVVDSDGNGVSQLDLRASWDGGSADATTSASGKALLDVEAGANVSVTVDDDEYVRNAPFNVTNATGGTYEVPVTESGTATIEVVDAQGPVDGAVVQMQRQGTYVVNSRTDADGTVASGDVEQGEYTVRSWKNGYLRNATTVTVDGDETHRVRLRQGSRTLTVNVTDDHFSPPQPVENANVTVVDRGTVTTLPNGQTTLSVPVNTEYDVTVSKGGYVANETTVKIRESDASTNLTIQRRDAVQLDAGQDRVVVGESVRMTATDEYGDPVADAEVTIDGESAGTTDDQGVLSVPIESAGSHTLVATSGGLEANATVEGVGEGNEATTGGETSGDDTATGTSDGLGPGFSVVAALVALVTVGLLSRRF